MPVWRMQWMAFYKMIEIRIVLNEIFMTNYEMLDNPEKYLYQYK